MSFNEVFSVVQSGSIVLVAGVFNGAISAVPIAQSAAGQGPSAADTVMFFRTTPAGTLGSYIGNLSGNDAAGVRTITLNASSYLNAGGFNNADTSTLQYIVLRRNV